MKFERDRVVALYLAGKLQVAILSALQHLNVNQSFVTRNIAHYHDTGSIASRAKSEQKKKKKTVTRPEMIRKVKARFYRNPRHSGRKFSRELDISQEGMQYILKNVLGLKPLKFQKVQQLTKKD